MKIFFFALVIHVLFLFVAFDIHFTSPVVKNIASGSIKKIGIAKRLVLFVADGLRYDTFWKTNNLYLHNISRVGGIWGKSTTRVPTESRTGHVALIAGFYEDPSAVFKGWKENPVDFDSVFNQSRYTWTWGSPDILRVFAKGFNSDHVFSDSYSSYDEDFSGADAYKTDEWVFDKFEIFLKNASGSASLGRMVNQDKVVFFLHLLGLDTNGHSRKPHSREYEENLRYVDKKVKEIEESINEFFGDKKTAFLFTSDHGMTDWGSHGAGDPTETDTPFVAWGAGVYKPPVPAADIHSVRRDCNQGDLTPLMASLVGINVPVNSMGFLRVDHLADDLKFRAESMLANADQMFRQFHTLEEQRRTHTIAFVFQPYKPLVDSHFALKDIQSRIEKGFYSEAIEAAEELHQICSSGIIYYQRYDRPWLYCIATLGFVGWIAYVSYNVIGTDLGRRANKKVLTLFAVIGCFLTVYILCERAPLQYILYVAVPVTTWGYVLSRIPRLDSFKSLDVTAPTILAVIFGTNLLVMSFFHRWCLSLILVGAAFIPFVTVSKSSRMKKMFWALACLVLATMPLLPVVGQQRRLALVYIGSLLILPIIIGACVRLRSSKVISQRSEKILVLQILLIAASCFVKYHAFSSVEAGRGLPLLDQVFSWAVLAQSFVAPLLVELTPWVRLFSIFLGLLPAFILLSMSHEVLFYGSFSAVLFAWILLESPKKFENKECSAVNSFRNHFFLTNDDVRISFLYLFFTVMSFFGLGNVASVNSFDPSASFCFITTFSPIVVMLILLWKILVPFLLVGCAVATLEQSGKVEPRNVLLLNLIFSDIMGLQFFYLVTDTGSWLEIGTSISHFVIVEVTVLFLLVLKVLSKFLLGFELMSC